MWPIRRCTAPIAAFRPDDADDLDGDGLNEQHQSFIARIRQGSLNGIAGNLDKRQAWLTLATRFAANGRNDALLSGPFGLDAGGDPALCVSSRDCTCVKVSTSQRASFMVACGPLYPAGCLLFMAMVSSFHLRTRISPMRWVAFNSAAAKVLDDSSSLNSRPHIRSRRLQLTKRSPAGELQSISLGRRTRYGQERWRLPRLPAVKLTNAVPRRLDGKRSQPGEGRFAGKGLLITCGGESILQTTEARQSRPQAIGRWWSRASGLRFLELPRFRYEHHRRLIASPVSILRPPKGSFRLDSDEFAPDDCRRTTSPKSKTRMIGSGHRGLRCPAGLVISTNDKEFRLDKLRTFPMGLPHQQACVDRWRCPLPDEKEGGPSTPGSIYSYVLNPQIPGRLTARKCGSPEERIGVAGTTK